MRQDPASGLTGIALDNQAFVDAKLRDDHSVQ